MHYKKYWKHLPLITNQPWEHRQCLHRSGRWMPINQTNNKTWSSLGEIKSFKKPDDVKIAFIYNRRNPTNANARKLKKVQSEPKNTYVKEHAKYIQDQIDKIKDSIEDRKSRIAWQTVNEVSRRKSTARAKLKAASQEEWIYLRKHFKNLLGKSLKVMD